MVGGVSLSVHIYVDTSSEPVAGSIQPEAAPPRNFTGWMELVAHLADLLAAATEQPDNRIESQ